MSDPIEAIAMNVNDNIEYLKEQDSHRYAVHMDYEPPGQDGCSVSVNLPLKVMSLWLYKHDVLITTEDRSAATGSDGANEEGAATSRQPFPHEQDDSSDDLMDEPRSEAADVQPRQNPPPAPEQVSDVSLPTSVRLQEMLQECQDDKHKLLFPMRLLQDIVQEDVALESGQHLPHSSKDAVKDKELKALKSSDVQYALKINDYLRAQLTSIFGDVRKRCEYLHLHAAAGPLLLVSPELDLSGQHVKFTSRLRSLLEGYRDVDAALANAYLRYSVVDNQRDMDIARFYGKVNEGGDADKEKKRFMLVRAETVVDQIKAKIKDVVGGIPLGAHYLASAEDEDFKELVGELRMMIVW